MRTAEWFVADMKKQHWENLPDYGFKIKGPFPYVEPVTIHIPKRPSAREMLSAVMQGAPFHDEGSDYATALPSINATEYWEFEIKGVFVHEEILTEYPDPHEEERV